MNVMTSKRKVYFKRIVTNYDPPTIGRGYLLFHISGHPNCTPNHAVYTSDVVKVYKNGNFETENSHWLLVK